MYIIYSNGKFELSENMDHAVAKIEAPIYVENGEEKQLMAVRGSQTSADSCKAAYTFVDAENLVEVTIEKQSDTLFYIRRNWKNLAEETRNIQTVLRIKPCFEVKKHLIPNVSINGNEFGNGLEPKGLERDGKKWIFGYDRVSLPAMTLTENDDFAVALFASAEDEASLVSSCSISKDKATGAFIQELIHPVVEQPVTYSTRDGYAEGYETFIELGANVTFDCGMYLSVSKPMWKNYGAVAALDSALEIFGDNDYIQTPTDKEVWDRSITFAKSLITHYKDKKGFIIGFGLDEKGNFVYRGDECFELAWCGQNILYCRMLVEDYIRFGHEDSLAQALEILDTRVKYATAESGLLAAQLSSSDNLNAASADTCNMGYGAYEYVRVYELLKKIGIEKPEYLQAAKGMCDFFCDHYSEEYGFGKQWRLDGVCLDENGAIGAFVIPALAELYKVTGEQKYLELAEKSMEFYVHRDIDDFCCTAGALDTSCVDKETSAPFLMSAVLLYEITGKDIYLEYGKKAAYYFISWMFHYQPVYSETSEITKYNVSIKGLTSVSTQHHHVDMYGGIVVPYFYKLADFTGDERFRVRGDMLWKAVLQCISDGTLVIHEKVRPVGSQNEAIFHCRWAFHGAQHYTGERGCLNDWLVAWPCAFRLSVLAEKPEF